MPSDSARSTRRLLIIEDDADLADALRVLLADDRVEAQVASTGVEGIARARLWRPDAIVLDVQIPGLDGFEVFQLIRRDADLRDAAIVIVSAHAPRGAFSMLEELGAHACFPKPFDLDRFGEAVRAALRLPPEGREPAEPGVTRETIVARRETSADPVARVTVVSEDRALVASIVAICGEELGPGALVRCEPSVAAAAAHGAGAPPDMVFVDLDVAGVDPAGAVAALRRTSRARSTPVIVLASTAEWPVLARALDAGAEGYAPKPVDRAILAGFLRRLRREGTTPPPVERLLEAGTRIAGRYVVRALLGRGGMGCVYRVEDERRRTDVALKIMEPSAGGLTSPERFRREAEIMLRLTHEGIVRVFDIGEDGPTGARFFTMELLEGCSLRRWLQDRRGSGTPVPLEAALDVSIRVLEALAYAHRTTVHRDLKPENIFLVAGDPRQPKILDFGIAKLAAGPGFTTTSVGFGTPYYVAPEQQEDAARVDARADLYSVAVMLYEMLAGKLPIGCFESVRAERPDVAAALDELIQRALAADPARRPPSADAFARALREAMPKPALLLEAI